MPATLVVVDMQTEFDAANWPEVVVGVTREILEAKRKNWPILILEYRPVENIGYTHFALTKLLKGYSLKARIGKDDDDGSLEVIRAVRRRGFYNKKFRVCGVNTDCCVAATVMGLINRTESVVEVVKDACESEHQPEFDWRHFFKHPRIKLV